jgi:dihydroorotate dehydrogenase electron transfer subunit
MELKKKLMAAKIISHEEITPVVKKMVLLAPEIASEVQPGQFVMVRPEQSRYFLRRPISVADADLEAGTFTLIYRMVGGGTWEMAGLAVGDTLSVEGPLGQGFSLFEGTALLVGGGVGIAPLIFLAHRLPVKPVLLIGGRSQAGDVLDAVPGAVCG